MHQKKKCYRCFDDLMLLCEADITSKNEVRKQRFLENFKQVRQKLKDLIDKDYKRLFQPPINGDEIMRIFNIQPCREVGILKETLKNAILDGKIPNDYDISYQFILDKAKKMGLTPKKQD